MAQQQHHHKLKEHHYVHPINIVGEGNGKKKREKFALSKFRVTQGMGQVDETFTLNLQQAIRRRKRGGKHHRRILKKEYALFESIAFQIKFLSSLPYEKRLMVFDCFEIVQVESHTVLSSRRCGRRILHHSQRKPLLCAERPTKRGGGQCRPARHL